MNWIYFAFKQSNLFCLFSRVSLNLRLVELSDRTGVHMQCTSSVHAVWAACRLHWLCSAGCNYTAICLECSAVHTAVCSVSNPNLQSRHSVCAVHTVVCSVSEVYLQLPLQTHSSSIWEHTCAYVWWALMHHFPSVRCHLTKSQD